MTSRLLSWVSGYEEANDGVGRIPELRLFMRDSAQRPDFRQQRHILLGKFRDGPDGALSSEREIIYRPATGFCQGPRLFGSAPVVPLLGAESACLGWRLLPW
jgi:hypothetical protein